MVAKSFRGIRKKRCVIGYGPNRKETIIATSLSFSDPRKSLKSSFSHRQTLKEQPLNLVRFLFTHAVTKMFTGGKRSSSESVARFPLLFLIHI